MITIIQAGDAQKVRDNFCPLSLIYNFGIEVFDNKFFSEFKFKQGNYLYNTKSAQFILELIT